MSLAPAAPSELDTPLNLDVLQVVDDQPSNDWHEEIMNPQQKWEMKLVSDTMDIKDAWWQFA